MKPKKKPIRRNSNRLTPSDRQKAKEVKMMTGQELFQKYLEQPPENLPHFLQSLSWEDVMDMGEEMTKRAQEARDAGDTNAVLNLVSRSIPFLEYFEEK